MLPVYDPPLPEPSVEQEVNEAGIRETTLQFDEPVYDALQQTWHDPRTAEAAEPLLEEGYVDAFHEGFDTITFYTPEDEPLEAFIDNFLAIVASHYTPPRTVNLERSGWTATYRGYPQDGGTVIDVRFDEAVAVLPAKAAEDETFLEDVDALTGIQPNVITAEDYDALQEEVFHIYTDADQANVDAFMDAYLDRLDALMDKYDV